jgi:hypothetical protein
MRSEQERPTTDAKQVTNGGVGNIEATCISAEGWQDDPAAVRDKAGTRNAAGTASDPRAWMIVAGNFGDLRTHQTPRLGLVAKDEAPFEAFLSPIW